MIVHLTVATLIEIDACPKAIRDFRKVYGEEAHVEWDLDTQLEFIKGPLGQYFGWAAKHRLVPRFSMADVDLSGLDLTGVDLSLCDLSGAKLVGTNLTGAKLVGTNLTGADLSSAKLVRADLLDANFMDTTLTNTDLKDAYQWESTTISSNTPKQ